METNVATRGGSVLKSYRHTLYASYLGYITQAIVNNFVPLLFTTFIASYGISLEKITLLVTINFGIQLVVDFLSARFVDKIGYKVSVVAAHLLAAAAGGLRNPAGSAAGPLRGHADIHFLLRHRRRPDRGTDQPYRGGLPL